AFKAANQKKLAELVGLVELGDGSLVYRDSGGNLGRCDFATGEKLESMAFPESSGGRFFFAFGQELMSLASDGKSFQKMTIDDGWSLVMTLGDINDPAVFVDRVTALDISADGTMLATGSGEPSRSGEIKIWSLADGKLVREIKDAHSDTILDIRFSPDGKRLASGSSDRFMKTFDLESGKLIRVFEGHTHHVMSIDWNSIGRELSSAGADKVVKVWDAETGTQKRTISGYGKEVTSLSFVELSNNIITTSGDKTVRLKRTDNGGEVRQFAGNSDFVYAVATTADGKKFAAGGEDSTVRIWTDSGQVFVEFPPPKE
ncbi:MAG: WD40 repeat domain-containing protein, partial [Planctomycetota bacterium]|nr:WD40 repeat domain-containing protein [Planctomycetota bacterium]